MSRKKHAGRPAVTPPPPVPDTPPVMDTPTPPVLGTPPVADTPDTPPVGRPVGTTADRRLVADADLARPSDTTGGFRVRAVAAKCGTSART